MRDATMQKASGGEVSDKKPLIMLRAWLVLLAAYAAIVPTSLVDLSTARWITDVAGTTAAAIAGLSSLRAARAAERRDRLAWRLFAIGCFAWSLGQLGWSIYDIAIGRATPIPSLADIGFLVFGLAMVAGFVILRATQRERRLTWLRIANLGLILCGLAVLLIAMFTQPFLGSSQAVSSSLVVVAETASASLAFILALYVLWSYRWDDRLASMGLLTLSLATHMITDLFYTRELVTEQYDEASWVNIGWLVSFGVHQWAAETQVAAASHRAAWSASLREKQGWVEALVPSFLVLCMAFTAIALAMEITQQVVLFGSFALGAFAIVLALREGMLHRHGLLTRERLQDAVDELTTAREQLSHIEQQRLELRRYLDVAARAGGVGLWEWDLRTNVVHFSPEWKRQLGYEAVEIRDDIEEWRLRVHPDDLEPTTRTVHEFLQHPSGELVLEQRIRHRDGAYRWILMQASVTVDDRGKPERMLGSHVDITRRKHVEISLRDSERRYRELADNLEARVEERTQALLDAYRESRNFAYAVAHDLKAPLRAIDGFSHLLEQSAIARLSEAEQGYFKRVRQGAIHMASLIDSLLAYSRLEHRELRICAVDVREIIDEVLRSMEPLIHEVNATVTVSAPSLCVLADIEGVRLIVRNLLDNALKFTSSSRPLRVDIGATADAESVTLSVADNGIGFDPQYHDKIFEIFQRLHSDGYSGTGMGLALVRKAVHRMHGKIWAQSAPNQGATFYVKLPLATDTTASPPAA